MSDTKTALNEQRAQNRLRVEQIRGHRLDALAKKQSYRRELQEALAYDWVGPYTDLLAQNRRDPVIGGISTANDRRRGDNYPIFRSEQELALLRAPARILCSTNSYAQGLLEGLTSYVVGTGFTYRVSVREDSDDAPHGLAKVCQRVIDDFTEASEWYGGEMPGLEEELFWRSCEDGEFFLLHCERADGGTDVRTAEPEQITQPPGTDQKEWSYGVRTDTEDVQKPLGYWYTWTGIASDGEEYSPDEVTHYRRNVKRSIKRGLTDFSFDTLDALTGASTLRSNLGDTAAQQAAIVAVMQHQTGTQQDIEKYVDDQSEWDSRDPLTNSSTPTRRNRKGQFLDISKNQQYVSGPLAQSSPIHLQVLGACLRGAGVRWNAPEWLVSGDASNNNYASSLTAESPFTKTVQRKQKSLGTAFVRTMWVVLQNWYKVHGIHAMGRSWSYADIKALLSITAEARSPETRDKLAEAQQASIEIPLGVDSRQRYAQQQGRDWERIEADNAKWSADHAPTAPTEIAPGPSVD